MAHSTKKLGFAFTMMGWILGFILLALVFNKILDQQHNPNQNFVSKQTESYQEIVLQRNRAGHYLFDGKINNRKVTFLVDTGATTTSIPANLAEYLSLNTGFPFSVSTANGIATAYSTSIDKLQLGSIVLYNVRASLNPGLQSEILLGMNVLKHMELIQRGELLFIRNYR